jgi:hypothetical protein
MTRCVALAASSLQKLALGAAAALAFIGLGAGKAEAYVVTVGGVEYNVTTFTGTYNSNISKFDLPANGGVMPWWGSSTLASEFATKVSSFFGYPNGPAIGCTTTCGPIFGYAANLGTIPNLFGLGYAKTAEGPTNAVVTQPQTASFTWAQVSPVPAPAPLPLLGAAAAFGYSRKLRKRIQVAGLPAASPRA